MAFTTIQAGRALAAISVVLFHTEVTLRLDKYLGASVFPAASAMHFGVNFFFVLSGFIMATVHWGDIGKPEAVRNFLIRRFSRIYPPLWAALALSALLTVVVGSGSPTMAEGILAIAAVPLRVHEPLLAVEWTLRHEVLFYGLCATAIWRPLVGVSIMVAWAIAPYIYIMPTSPRLVSVLLSPYNALFILGIAAAIVCRYTLFSVVLAIATFATGAVLFIFSWFSELRITGETYALGTLLYGVGSALVLIGMVKAEQLGIMKAPPCTHVVRRRFLLHLSGSFLGRFGCGQDLRSACCPWMGIEMDGVCGGGCHGYRFRSRLLYLN